MGSHQGEPGGLAVIEAGIRPAGRVVAQAAVRPKLAVVGVVGFVTGRARLRQPRKLAVGVTRLTGQALMRSHQGKPGDLAVIEAGIRPAGRVVAKAAVRPKLAVVGVVGFVAGSAGLRQP